MGSLSSLSPGGGEGWGEGIPGFYQRMAGECFGPKSGPRNDSIT